MIHTRTEGVYTYWCSECETSFAVVSKFKEKEDFNDHLKCPKCQSKSNIAGEGFVRYSDYELIENDGHDLNSEEGGEELPEVLTAEDISNFLSISRRRVYEFMKQNDFPLIPLGISKRVLKSDFFKWIESQKR